MFVNLDACMASQAVTLAVHAKLQVQCCICILNFVPPCTCLPAIAEHQFDASSTGP